MEQNDGQSSETILVVPCYNEAKRLEADKFQTFVAEESGVRFLFVNDGSTDDTSAVLQKLHESRPESFLVNEFSQNRGKAEAVRAGFLRAIELSPTYVGFWDADLSTPLDEVAGMLAVFRSCPQIEMVFGARVNLLGRKVRRKLHRHYLGRVFASAVARALGIGIYDTQCGAKLFRTNDQLAELFQAPFLSKWIFDVEIIARSINLRRDANLTPVTEIIYEQPLMSWSDVAGSKLKFRDFFIVYRDFLRICRHYMWRGW